MLFNLLSVAAGGAAGSVLRYLVGIGAFRLAGPGFPLGVLTVNIVGSFLMGVLVGISASRGLSSLSPLVMTGFLGGFTTFSAFSLEAVTLYERGELGQAALYVGLSVVGSIAALMAGLWIARQLA